MINRVEIRDNEQQLVMRVVGGLRQQIQFTINLFKPDSISEAHQQALTIEAQTRSGFSAWGSARHTRSSTAATSTVPTSDATSKPDTAVVPIDPSKQQRPVG